MSGVWITAGAPLPTHDGWRVWYSWKGPPDEPALPRVRLVGGADVAVTASAFEFQPGPPVSERLIGVRELRLEPFVPGATYELDFPQRDEPLRWRTLPAELPPEGVSILIASCFWLNGDKDGFYAAAMRELVERERPAFKVLMGDQVYLDVWPPAITSVSAGMSERYERYWGNEPYREMLAGCPTIMSSDDHEYWNDFPKKSPWPPMSLLAHGETKDATRRLYGSYQAALNPGATRWSRLEIGRVSLFVTDMRYDRTDKKAAEPHLMLEPQWQALEAWVDALEGPGVLFVSQPIMKAGGSRTDSTIVDYARDADRLAAVIERALAGETKHRRAHDILVLTGDIHTGRLSSATIAGVGELHEFVVSPASRVTPLPVGEKPNELPRKLTIAGHKWTIDAHRGLTTTIDDNVGVVRFSEGLNGRVRVTLRLWRVRGRRPRGLSALLRLTALPPPRTPIHDPIELQLR